MNSLFARLELALFIESEADMFFTKYLKRLNSGKDHRQSVRMWECRRGNLGFQERYVARFKPVLLQ
ncbi:hypothetical protein Enr17x_20030 [Gimesia fumaroli]|uniref:Uncharacterized protein n=1 Tax=Gimesia fumaroli TaxID=2527976 RepID=A0A518IA22_9PLAN|nr:hypothetical protein Enr17x_20030 [Gimesia fumaroli]